MESSRDVLFSDTLTPSHCDQICPGSIQYLSMVATALHIPRDLYAIKEKTTGQTLVNDIRQGKPQ